jgi:hypothetical protein
MTKNEPESIQLSASVSPSSGLLAGREGPAAGYPRWCGHDARAQISEIVILAPVWRRLLGRMPRCMEEPGTQSWRGIPVTVFDDEKALRLHAVKRQIEGRYVVWLQEGPA